MDSDDADATTEAGQGGSPDAGIPRFTSAVRYDIGDLIAKGGMGEVFAAKDRQIGREVAIKRMRAERTSARGMARFFHEAMIQGRLDHPAIVPVHEVGIDPDGRPFFVMKKLAGKTLAEVIAARPRERLLRAFVDVCLAVEFAHEKGVVHRDLKPANIVLGDFGEVYVLDWGVARVLDADTDDDHALAGSDDEGDRTDVGTAVGTPGYMAPEQVRSASSIDARADVYALGCILFEILAGQRLHPAREAVVQRTLGGIDARPSSRGVHVPPELEALCVAATAVAPVDRISSARALGERVQAFLDGDRDVAQRRELARTHLGAAELAYAQADRAAAMREAGRAIALDPHLDPAAALVGRLMLEPPAEVPAEVARTLADEDAQTILRNARTGSRAYLAFAGFIPILLASPEPRYAIALAAMIIATTTLLLVWKPPSRARMIAVAGANTLLIALLARMFSPFFIAPGIAAIATMALVLSPDYDVPRRVLGLTLAMAAAIIVPYLAEALGLISPTMTITLESVEFAGPASGLPTGPAVSGLVLYVFALLAAAGGLGHAMRRAERAARTRLHLQAWQLGQLVPRT